MENLNVDIFSIDFWLNAITIATGSADTILARWQAGNQWVFHRDSLDYISFTYIGASTGSVYKEVLYPVSDIIGQGWVHVCMIKYFDKAYVVVNDNILDIVTLSEQIGTYLAKTSVGCRGNGAYKVEDIYIDQIRIVKDNIFNITGDEQIGDKI